MFERGEERSIFRMLCDSPKYLDSPSKSLWILGNIRIVEDEEGRYMVSTSCRDSDGNPSNNPWIPVPSHEEVDGEIRENGKYRFSELHEAFENMQRYAEKNRLELRSLDGTRF